MKLSYIDFLKKTRGKGNYKLIEDFPDATRLSHGSKHESFRRAYQESYSKPGAEIIPVHDDRKLRLGFIEKYGSSQIWHTVRLEAWHTSANKGCELEDYIEKLIGEKIDE